MSISNESMFYDQYVVGCSGIEIVCYLFCIFPVIFERVELREFGEEETEFRGERNISCNYLPSHFTGSISKC